MEHKLPNCELEVVEVDGEKRLKAKCADMESAIELKDLLAETVNITVEPKGGDIEPPTQKPTTS